MEMNDTVRSETPNSLRMTFFSNARLLYQLVFRKMIVVELHIVHDVFGYTLSKQCEHHSDFRMKKLHNKFKPI
jgi:hypothetical protein